MLFYLLTGFPHHLFGMFCHQHRNSQDFGSSHHHGRGLEYSIPALDFGDKLILNVAHKENALFPQESMGLHYRWLIDYNCLN